MDETLSRATELIATEAGVLAAILFVLLIVSITGGVLVFRMEREAHEKTRTNYRDDMKELHGHTTAAIQNNTAVMSEVKTLLLTKGAGS